MRHAAIGSHSGVIALLVAIIDAAAREDTVAVVFVRGGIADADVRREARSTVLGSRQIEVRAVAGAGRIVARIVESDDDFSRDRVYGEPLIEPVDGEWEPIADFAEGRLRRSRRPGEALVVGRGQEDAGCNAVFVEVHPRAVQPPPVRPTRSIRVAGRIDECAPVELRSDSYVE